MNGRPWGERLDMPTLTIDGREVVVPEGATVLDACRQNGIDIPTMCFLEGLKPYTSCMLCVVKQFGVDRLVPSCSARVSDGMIIVTDDAENVRNLPYEAAMAAAYGLPAAEALRAITLSPAEIFGVADRVGAIAPGRDATLVLAAGDILDTRTQVTQVLVEGVPQPLETRHTRLYERYKDRP